MSLLTIFLVIIVVGVLLWAVNTYIPMADGMKKLLNIAAVVVVVIWLLKGLGLLPFLANIKL